MRKCLDTGLFFSAAVAYEQETRINRGLLILMYLKHGRKWSWYFMLLYSQQVFQKVFEFNQCLLFGNNCSPRCPAFYLVSYFHLSEHLIRYLAHSVADLTCENGCN